MTRAKGWLTLTGLGSVAKKLFREIDAILEEVGKVKLIVPDMKTIQRNLETYENQRRRKRIRKGLKGLNTLLEIRGELESGDVNQEEIKQLEQLLKRLKNQK